MKKTLALCCLFLLPGQFAAAQAPQADQSTASKPDQLTWTVMQEWKMKTKPVDFVQALDGRIVFVLGDDSKVHLYSAEGQELGEIPVDQSTVAIDIAPRGEMLYLVDQNQNYKALDISFAKDIDVSGSPVKGKADAPVSIVVFSDFQCPFCSRIEPILAEVLKRNPDTVNVIFKHMPLGMHQQAEPAARAAIAAQQQGKLWEMHDALFAAASKGKLNAESIEKAAKDLGLDMKKFKADVNSEATKERLSNDLSAARLAEVNGTPTLFVNGRRVNSPSPDFIQKMLDQELAKKK
jgi:protein-disulfide isomerase